MNYYNSVIKRLPYLKINEQKKKYKWLKVHEKILTHHHGNEN